LLNREINAGLVDARIRSRLDDLGAMVLAGEAGRGCLAGSSRFHPPLQGEGRTAERQSGVG